MLAEQLHVTVLPHDRRLELIQFLNKIMYPLFYTPVFALFLSKLIL